MGYMMKISDKANALAKEARDLKAKGTWAMMQQGPELLDDVINLTVAMAEQIDKLTSYVDEV